MTTIATDGKYPSNAGFTFDDEDGVFERRRVPIRPRGEPRRLRRKVAE